MGALDWLKLLVGCRIGRLSLDLSKFPLLFSQIIPLKKHSIHYLESDNSERSKNEKFQEQLLNLSIKSL